MNTKYIWLSVVAVIVSFIGGFLLANALNKSEIANLRSENERQKKEASEAPQNQNETTLSDEEIKKRISEADQNPTNFAFQKSLGLALYQYAGMKQNADLLGEVTRLLDRSYQNNPNDYDVLVALGNSYFDIGLLKKEQENLIKSRSYYQKALDINPGDIEVTTDLGLTFLLISPPETEKALSEFKKSLEKNPNHEKTLRGIAQALISQKNFDEAEKYISTLQKVNPQSPHLVELQEQLKKENSEPKIK